MSIFKKATNTMAFAKVGILGFAGAGKTRTATEIAVGLHKAIGSTKPVLFIDTETGSDFVLPIFQKHGIEMMVSKTRAFKDLASGLREAPEISDILIIDSVSHFWVDIVESYRKKKNVNRLSFQDWGIIKPMWNNDFSTPFVTSPLHIIVAGRAGFEYDYFEGDDGKMELYKTGTKMKAEGEFGFEPSLLIEMERIKNPEATESYREAKTKDAKMKAAKQIMAEREFVRRATVLKDRSDIMDGKVFYNPSYADFAEHWNSINIGGEHKPLEAGDSQGLFNKEGQPQWKVERTRAEIALEEIKAEVEKFFPGTSAKEKQAKIRLSEKVFGTASGKALEGMSYMVLEDGLRRIKDIFTVPENTLENMAAGKITEPPAEDVQDFDETKAGETGKGAAA
ncbi:MAG: AAA family ATPase [Syntrophales bacterium]|nr:AAA family ATPase [Syntrophales bacterium]